MFALWLLVVFVVGGLGFAGMATWLTTTRGNTMSEVMASQHFENAEAVKLEILDKLKITSNVPIFSLYLVALVCAVGPVITLLWINRDDVVTLSGSLALPRVGGERMDPQVVWIRPDGMKPDESGHFQIELLHTKAEQDFTIGSPSTEPITLSATLDPFLKKVQVSYTGGIDPQAPEVEDYGSQQIARLRPTSVVPAIHDAGHQLANVPTEKPPVPATDHAVAGPVLNP